MQLSPSQLADFKDLYVMHFGVELNDDDAVRYAQQLLSMTIALLPETGK